MILIPFVGNLSDKIGRRPCIIVGSLGSAVLAYPYLYFVAEGNFWMAFLFAMLMWGVIYQGYNAVFPAFYQELFPTATRVTAFAIAQNPGTLVTAFLPAIYARSPARRPGLVVDKKFAPDAVLPSGQTCRAAADTTESRRGLDDRQHYPGPRPRGRDRRLQCARNLPDAPARPRN